MNNTLTLILFLLTIHYIADFILQSHWMATNKSSSDLALTAHVITYSVAFLLALIIALVPKVSLNNVLVFVVLNSVLHWITDYITSRISKQLYAKQDYHNFFVCIGADQLIHQYTLILSGMYLLV